MQKYNMISIKIHVRYHRTNDNRLDVEHQLDEFIDRKQCPLKTDPRSTK